MKYVNYGNYVTIQGWMRTELELSGTELMLYALIYGFSQAENQAFTGSLRYLCEWTGKSKPTVLQNLKNLEDKGLIRKEEKEVNKVKCVFYYAGGKETLPGVVKKFNRGGKETLPGGGKETLPNNINIYTLNDNIVYTNVISDFNSVCISLPKVKAITETRKKAIKGADEILKQYDKTFKELFQSVERSDFLSGRSSKWKASFDWIFKKSNLIKILEGNYSDNKGSDKLKSPPSYDLDRIVNNAMNNTDIKF